MLKLDKKFINYLQENNIKKIKIFFYEAGCSGTKIDVIFDDFITDNLLKIPLLTKEGLGEVYIELKDAEKFENAIITRTITKDHTGKEKIRYIFTNKEVKERCGCGSSFSFEKKAPKLDLTKLKDLKKNFGR